MFPPPPRAPEVVTSCKKLMSGPDRTSAYWALLLVNQLGTSEPVVMEEAAEQVWSVNITGAAMGFHLHLMPMGVF